MTKLRTCKECRLAFLQKAMLEGNLYKIWQDTSKQASKQAGKQASQQASRQGSKQAGKQDRQQASKQAGKQASKSASKPASKQARPDYCSLTPMHHKPLNNMTCITTQAAQTEISTLS